MITNKIVLTKLEKAVMLRLTEDDFFENGVDSCLWKDIAMDTLASVVKGKAASGVISSLSKKGVILCSDNGYDKLNHRDDDTIEFTALGKQYLIDNVAEIEDGYRMLGIKDPNNSPIALSCKVIMFTFTGMRIPGEFDVSFGNDIYLVTTKKGILKFGINLVQLDVKNVKYANRIELAAE